MADDKSKRDGSDRTRVAGNEGYEVDYFARKHGISQQQARELIDRVGNDREKLDAAVVKKPATRGRPRRSGAATPARKPKAASPAASAAAKVRTPSRAGTEPTSAAQPAKPRSPLIGAAKSQVSGATDRGVRAVQRTSSGVRKFVADLPGETMKPVRGVARRAESIPGFAALAVLGAAAAGFLGGLALGRRAPAESPRPVDGSATARRADGSDDSASFGAMIADEGTIPDTGATGRPTAA